MLKYILQEIASYANPKKALDLQHFFKTGEGEYGEGDLFLGITVPVCRIIAKKYKSLPLTDVKKLLQNKYHENRLIALMILIQKTKKADETTLKDYFNIYLMNTQYINNWDLVDLSAYHIVGTYLLNKDKKILYKLAASENIWERRIAILSCFAFIKENTFDISLEIAQLLLHDTHDLIHKAVGWMLREIGKRNQTAEEHFLKIHYKYMPRTMLRYAIERFPENKRRAYLKGKM